MGVLTRALRRVEGPAVAVVALATLAGTGCTHLSTVSGAIPLAPGTSDFTVQLEVARAPNAISTPAGTPLPAFSGHYRRGLSPDLDVGIHIYSLGVGADLRYRFAEVAGWSFAVAPGFAGTGLPIPGLQYGHLDLSLPLRTEKPIGKGWSVAGGPAVLARQTFVAAQAEALSTATATFELYAGGGLRLQRLGKRLKLGFSVDVYADTTRATGLYGGVGIDMGTVARDRARKRAAGISGGGVTGGAPSGLPPSSPPDPPPSRDVRSLEEPE